MNEWTERIEEFEALRTKMAGIAADHGLVLNPDAERAAKVLGLMTENLALTGRPYCPCKQSRPLDPEKDTTCPCPTWREEIEAEGHCFCRLFYRP